MASIIVEANILPADAVSVAEKALRDSGLNLSELKRQTDRCVAQTRASMASWGETIQVWAEPQGGTKVRFHVISDSIAQLFDWGKNQQNVNRIRESLVRLTAH